MKLPRHVFVAWWHVHAWAGVLAALVLAAMFLGGAFSLFRHELETWQDPPAASADRAAADAALFAALRDRPVDGKAIGVQPAGERSVRAVLWVPKANGQGQEPITVDPGGAVPRTSRVADVFFHLHFLWHEDVPIGMVIAGLLGVVFLLAVVTGVAIHLKDVGRQMYRFRPAARPRALWSDLHKVLGMWGLPFQIMIALTGALICVLGMLSPHVGRAVFDGNQEAAAAELAGGEPAPPRPSGARARPLGFGALVTIAEKALPGMHATYVQIEPWGDAAAVATVYGERPGDGVYPEVSVRLRARDGVVLETRRHDDATVAHQAIHVVYGLHFARFGGLPLRLLYLVLGLAGWLTLMSGNWIWIERRRARGRGAEILARLTLGIGGGMLIAAAAVFWINRLAPADAARPALEVYGFFIVWAAVAVAGALLPARTRTWAALVAVAGLGFALVPVLSAIAGPTYAGAAGRTSTLVDLGLACAGAVCLIAARGLRRRSGSAVAA